ncbi:MAG: hypothetical protein KAT05_03680 [Spirochaetes bacterium]|nr:hypothetical protein [Spirochaetota bacterium]
MLISGCASNQSTCPEDITPHKECDSCCSSCPIYDDTTPFSECDSCCPKDTTPHAKCNSCCSECPPTQQKALLQCEESLEQSERKISDICYEDKMISQLQAENIAKRYALIQTKFEDSDITLQDIRLMGVGAGNPPSKIGNSECNPDWMAILNFNDTKKERCYWYLIRVGGKLENESMQGISNLPKEYVLKKVVFDWSYSAPISTCPYIGGFGSWSY